MSKEEFAEELVRHGYKAELDDCGVVMVVTNDYPALCHRIAKIAAKVNYRYSWGVKKDDKRQSEEHHAGT